MDAAAQKNTIDPQFTELRPINHVERQAMLTPVMEIPAIRVDRGDVIPQHVWDFWDGVTAPTVEQYLTQRIDAIRVSAGRSQEQFAGPDAQYKMSIMDRIDQWFIANEYRTWTGFKKAYDEGNTQPLRSQLEANALSAQEQIEALEKALANPLEDDAVYEQLASHMRAVEAQLDVTTNADEIVLLTQQKAEVQKHLTKTQRDKASANLTGKLTYLADMRHLLSQLPGPAAILPFPTRSSDTTLKAA